MSNETVSHVLTSSPVCSRHMFANLPSSHVEADKSGWYLEPIARVPRTTIRMSTSLPAHNQYLSVLSHGSNPRGKTIEPQFETKPGCGYCSRMRLSR